MIKCKTLGMIQIAKNNPVLTSVADVKNYDFIVVDGVTYLVANTITGDDFYKDDVTIKAGDFLNGYDVSAWANQELIVDESHIAYGVSEDYDDITAGTTLLGVITSAGSTKGKLEILQAAPSSGVYFKVTKKCQLIGKAVEVKVLVVDKDTVPSG